MRTLLAALLLASPAWSALAKLPPQTMALIDGARGLPPEFSADLLLRLVESPLITDREWKLQLIGEAWANGAHAQLPYRQNVSGMTDTLLSRSYRNNGLDSLSLQTRAVKAMLRLEAAAARTLFSDIRVPEVPLLSCQEPATPDLTAWYETAAQIFSDAFSAEEKSKSQHVQFLDTIVGRSQSPSHIVQAVRLIYRSSLTPEQRRDAIGVLAGAMGRVNGSARVFEAASFQLVPVSAPVKMPAGIRPADPLLPSPEGELPAAVLDGTSLLMPALRAYIVRHVSGERCSGNRTSDALPTPVRDFNYFVSKLDPTGTLYQPIAEEEARPTRDGGKPVNPWWWESPRSKQVLNALKWLNHGNRDLPDDKRFFTAEERQSTEWNARYVDTVKLLEGWNATEEISVNDWFGMVSETYQLLADKVTGEAQRGTIARYLNFMETNYASIESHNFWFTQLHDMWKSDSPVSAQLQRSSNPVISMYARVYAATKR